MTYSIPDALKKMGELFEIFRSSMQKAKEEYGEDCGSTTLLGVFGEDIFSRLKSGDTGAIPEVLRVIEDFMIEGTEDLKNAVATGFLESLINPGDKDVNIIISQHLGNECLAYCKAWDDFTGAKSQGLY